MFNVLQTLSESNLQNALCSFGTEYELKGGDKLIPSVVKRNTMIPLNPNSYSRRKYRQGECNRAQTSGAKPTGYLVSMSEDDPNAFSFPVSKSKKRPHSLSKAIENNTAPAKKHNANMN